MKEIEVVIIGLGAVGSVIADELTKNGKYSLTLLDKQYSRTRTLARTLNAEPIREIQELSLNKGLILLTVPDSEISVVTRQLLRQKLAWEKIVVMHTSGALGIEKLNKLAQKGAGVAAFHPYQTFPKKNKTHYLQSVTFGIEGNTQGVIAAKKLAKALGGKPLLVPPAKRTLYHLSAVMASGCIATDLWMATHILQSLGMTEQQALKIVLPITLKTVFNAVADSPKGAITGPAVRKDRMIMNLHQTALKKKFPELVKAYKEMSQLMMTITNKTNKRRKL
jgi:predicted short-subunit dehydrogenase-like oxidoreductase (DUF2520 family)